MRLRSWTHANQGLADERHRVKELLKRVGSTNNGFLGLKDENLGALTPAGWRLIARAMECETAITLLSLSSNNLGMLSDVSWQLLARAIEQNTSIAKLWLSENNLDTVSLASWQFLSGALSGNATLTELRLDRNELDQFPEGTVHLLAKAIEETSSIAVLSIARTNLGALSETGWVALTRAIERNASITAINLSGNKLGALAQAQWGLLARAIKRNPTMTYVGLHENKLYMLSDKAWQVFSTQLLGSRTIDAVDLDSNGLGKISNVAWRQLALALMRSTTINKLWLQNNDLGHLSDAVWTLLTCAITRSASISTLFLRNNRLSDSLTPNSWQRLVACIARHDFLERVILDPRDEAALTVALGPFDHTPYSAWQPTRLRRDRLLASLLYGIRPFSSRTLYVRAFWIGICLAALLLPRWYLDGVGLRHDIRDTASANATRALSFGMLCEHCGAANVPPVLAHAYVDAVSGFAIVLVLTLLWMVVSGVQRAGVAGIWCLRRVPGILWASRKLGALLRHLTALRNTEGVSSRRCAANPLFIRGLLHSGQQNKSLFLLLHVLCACTALGMYFSPKSAVSGIGTQWSLCWAAHTGLAIFYKPLAVPLWYCVITLLDVSGTKLSHNAMTETLTFVVHTLFSGWFAICGSISLPLYVPFLPIALTFFLLYYLYAHVYVPRHWGKIVPGMTTRHGSMVQASLWDITRERHGRYKEVWDDLGEAKKAVLVYTEQLGQRLLFYSTFVACTFGITLWSYWTGRGYVDVLEHASVELRLSVPVWDPKVFFARFEVFRWPKELHVVEQIPLYVSIALIVIEGTMEGWHILERFIAGDLDAAWHAPKAQDDADMRAQLGIVAESWRSRKFSLGGHGENTPSNAASKGTAIGGADVWNPAAFRPQVLRRSTTDRDNNNSAATDQPGSIPVRAKSDIGSGSGKHGRETPHSNPLGLDAKTLEILAGCAADQNTNESH